MTITKSGRLLLGSKMKKVSTLGPGQEIGEFDTLIDHVKEMQDGEMLSLVKRLDGKWTVISTSTKDGYSCTGHGATVNEAMMNEQEED